MPGLPEMQSFLPNDVLADLWEKIDTEFQAGTILADVYFEPPERIDTDLSIKSYMIVQFMSEQPSTDEICGNEGRWAGLKDIRFEVIIVSRDRYTAQDVWAKLEGYLQQGQFSFTMLTPPGGHSPFYYVAYLGMRKFHVESEGYGLQVDLQILTYRNFEVTL